jgi:hypothetical protein
LSNAYDDWIDSRKQTSTRWNQFQHALGGFDGLGFRPLTGASYICWKEGSTIYRKDGLNGVVDDSGSVAQTVINNAVTQASSDGGGVVWIRAASYGAVTVTVKDNVKLWVDFGATTLTFSVAAGADCMIQDYENGKIYYYVNGTLTYFLDMTTSGTDIVLAPDYTFWRNSNTYYCKAGDTGEVTSNSNFVTLVESVIGSNMMLYFLAARYQGDSALTIPDGTRELTFQGMSGLGKTYGEAGGSYGTHFEWSTNTIIDNDYTDDTRSVFGLTFDRIKFEGPDADASTALDMKNVDQLIVNYCHFYELGYGIKSVFTDSGTTYTLAEQPGTVRVANTTFSEMRVNDIYLERCTDCFIGPNVFFEAWGSVARRLHLKGCNAVKVHHNKFQKDGADALTEQIYIETIDGTYEGTQLDLHDNWVWLQNSGEAWIRTSGTDDIYNVTSLNNHIHHGYTPNELTDPGYIVLADEAKHQIMAHDQVNWVCNPISNWKDHTVAWAANTIRQNLWSPMEVKYTARMSSGGTCNVYMHETQAGIFNLLQADNNWSYRAQDYPLTFIVPTLGYWKVSLGGLASQQGQIVTYLS